MTPPLETAPLETAGLGKRYGRNWALEHCSLQVPPGRIAGLVGPNGAGKTTLLHLAAGLSEPTTGTIRLFGSPATQDPAVLARVGFLAQDAPLYRNLTGSEHLRMGRGLNRQWDGDGAEGRLRAAGIPLDRPVGRLSGGQRAQVALSLALGKQPDLLLLDEPVASLDPVARREFLRILMAAVAESGMTVVLSSHLLADLERVCDYLIVLAAGQVQLLGDVDDILTEHRIITGPRRDDRPPHPDWLVVEEEHSGRQSTFLVRTRARIVDPELEISAPRLEEVVLAYLSHPEVSALPPPAVLRSLEGVR